MLYFLALFFILGGGWVKLKTDQIKWVFFSHLLEDASAPCKKLTCLNYYPALCPWSKQAEAIGRRGQELMRDISMDRVYDYMFHLLVEYSVRVAGFEAKAAALCFSAGVGWNKYSGWYTVTLTCGTTICERDFSKLHVRPGLSRVTWRTLKWTWTNKENYWNKEAKYPICSCRSVGRILILSLKHHFQHAESFEF